MRRARLATVAIVAMLWVTVLAARAATITVTAASDAAVNLSDPAVTLRDAIHAAENDLQVAPGGPSGAGDDIIVFDPALTAGGDLILELTLFDTGVDGGELGPSAFTITSTITIAGPTGDVGIILYRASASAFRLFHVTQTGALTIEDLSLAGGLARGGHALPGVAAGGGGGAGIGGAILNEGALTLERCTLGDNDAVGGAGGQGSSSEIAGGGGGGGGVGGNGAGGTLGSFGAGGNPGGGASSGALGGIGGGGAGGNGKVGADAVGSSGGAGGTFGGGGAGGGGFGSGATTATGGNGASGGFGGGGGGGGPARATGGPETGGAGGSGGFGGGAGTNGGVELGGQGGSGGGGAALGGAIFNRAGTLMIANSTFWSNAATGGDSGGIDQLGFPTGFFASGGAGSGHGAAIFNLDGTVGLTSCTLAGNVVAAGSTNGGAAGGASGAVYTAGLGVTTLLNVLLDNAGDDCAGSGFVSQGYNLAQNDPDCALTEPTDRPNVDPMLATIVDNGGPTPTMLPGDGSEAIDGGTCVAGLSTDQRGVARPQGPACDIGAVESVATTTSTSTTSSTSSSNTSMSTTSTSTTSSSATSSTTSSTGASTTSSSTSTTTAPAPASSTSTTLIGDVRRPEGRKLVVKQKRTGAQRLAVVMSGADVSAADPCAVAGELAIQAIGASTPALRVALDAESWKPLDVKRPERGCRATAGTVAVRIKSGKTLVVKAAGADLGVPLATDPRPVRIELRHGDRRHCVEFGGGGRYKPGKKLTAAGAAAGGDCP